MKAWMIWNLCRKESKTRKRLARLKERSGSHSRRRAKAVMMMLMGDKLNK